MKNISLFLILIYVFASFSSYAEIYNPESIKEIKDMVGEIFEKRNPQKILFIFPIEGFILGNYPLTTSNNYYILNIISKYIIVDYEINKRKIHHKTIQ